MVTDDKTMVVANANHKKDPIKNILGLLQWWAVNFGRYINKFESNQHITMYLE
jgi:hypothetical protein